MKRIAALFAGILLLASALPCLSQLIQPSDLVYRGAFRLPDVSGDCDWTYSGHAMTYYPQGDPSGPSDGYPGSLFATGNDAVCQHVSEITIPAPVISAQKQLADLPVAGTLQAFSDIRGGVFGNYEDLVLPRAGLEYLPAQGSQTSDKLYFCWAQHIQDFEVSHGWCDLDLSNPQTAGPWYFGSWSNYVSNDYIFEIPAAWASVNTPGLLLATGRAREGPWAGLGPALFAYAPWVEGNPPAPNATLTQIVPLLLYGEQQPGTPEIVTDPSRQVNNYGDGDHWWSGAWLTADNNAAVIFVGTKGVGNHWYGFQNGTIWPYDCAEPGTPPCPDYPPYPYDNRGFWADDYSAQIMFYDPDDLAAVAQGTMESWEPQPYATMTLDDYLFEPYDTSQEETFLQRYKRDLVTAVAFDRTRGFLYVTERQVDDEKSIIHVWKVNDSASEIPFNVTGITTDLITPPAAGNTVQITFTASSASNSYCRWLSTSDLGNPKPWNWQTLANWTMNNNIVTWSPTSDGLYLVLAHVAEVANGTTFHQVGLIFETQGNSATPIQITGMTTNLSYPQSTETPITLSTTATGGSGQLYYRYFYRLGTTDAWTALGPWNTDASGTWTPAEDGLYTIVVHVSNDNSVENNPSVQAGITCTIGEQAS